MKKNLLIIFVFILAVLANDLLRHVFYPEDSSLSKSIYWSITGRNAYPDWMNERFETRGDDVAMFSRDLLNVLEQAPEQKQSEFFEYLYLLGYAELRSGMEKQAKIQDAGVQDADSQNADSQNADSQGVNGQGNVLANGPESNGLENGLDTNGLAEGLDMKALEDSDFISAALSVAYDKALEDGSFSLAQLAIMKDTVVKKHPDYYKGFKENFLERTGRAVSW